MQHSLPFLLLLLLLLIPLARLLFVILSNCRQKSYYAGHKLPSWRTFSSLTVVEMAWNGLQIACLFGIMQNFRAGKEFSKSDAGPEWWNELHSFAPRRQGLYAICPSTLPLTPHLQQSVCFLIRLHLGCISNAISLWPTLCLSLLLFALRKLKRNYYNLYYLQLSCPSELAHPLPAPARGAMQKFHQPLAKKSLELLLMMMFVLLSGEGMTKCRNVSRLRAEMLKFIPKNI